MRFQFIKREKQRNLLLNLSKINVVIMLGDRFCSNCFVVKTPLWRRDPKSGGHLCNACGLYQRNNSGSARPLERPKNTRVVSKFWQIFIKIKTNIFFTDQFKTQRQKVLQLSSGKNHVMETNNEWKDYRLQCLWSLLQFAQCEKPFQCTVDCYNWMQFINIPFFSGPTTCTFDKEKLHPNQKS